MNYCCEKFANQATSAQAPVGGGMLFPAEMQPLAQFERDGETWNIYGCCGGGCFVVTDMTFCPFCGAKLAHQGADR